MTDENPSLADRLAQLAELHSAGVLSDAELLSATARVLNRDATRPDPPPPPEDAVPHEANRPTGETLGDSWAVGSRNEARWRSAGRAPTKPSSGGRRRRWRVGVAVALGLMVVAASTLLVLNRAPATRADRAIASTAPSIAATPTPLASSSASATPSPSEPVQPAALDYEAAVWSGAADQHTTTRLYRLCPERCRKVILRLGRSEAAAEFYDETESVLVGVYPAGPVEVGFVVGPLGTNFGYSPFILGSDPSPLMPDDAVSGIVPHDPSYRDLLGVYPDMMVWGYDAVVEPPVATEDGGVKVTYQYPLHDDGSHAGMWVGAARITFTFGADGSLEKVRPAETCEGWYCPGTIDVSSPQETSAATPKEAVSMLVAAWRNDDKVAAAEVASADAIEFMWGLPSRSPDVAAGRCWKSESWEEYQCGLGDFMDDGTGVWGVPGATVLESSSGFFVADAEWYADA